MPLDPKTDPVLLTLERIATIGGDDHGPFFDQGVLAVVEQVKRDGKLIRNPLGGWLCMWKMMRDHQSKLLTADEIAAVERFLASKGWSLEVGAKYGEGLFCAQGFLEHLRPGE